MKTFQKQIENKLFSGGKLVSKRCSEKWLLSNFKEYTEIVELTNFLNSPSIVQRLWHAYHGIYEKSKCKMCGKECKFSGFVCGYLEHCCNSCAQKNPITQDKIQKTNLKKYGKKHGLSADVIKEKSKNTCFEKYGVKNISQLNSIKQKKEKTSLKNNGVKCILSNKSFIEQSVFEKYGKSNIMKVLEISQKAGRMRRSKFYDKMLSSNRLLGLSEPLFSKDEYINNGYYFHYRFKCSSCNNIFEDCLEDGDIPKCPLCFKTKSTFEFEVINYIKSIYCGIIIENDRTILNGKEIDIYLPNLKLGIECNGLHWHGELNGKNKNYHLNKTLDCSSKGIRLVHIFDDEWAMKRNIVKNYIGRLLNSSPKIYARNCIVKKITPKQSNEFLEKHHFQGKDNSSIKIGMFFQEELVSVMTFGKSRFEKDNGYELYRYCTNKNVVGGFKKLICYFKQLKLATKIITYSDSSKFTGKVYEDNGFKKVSMTSPGYWYFSRKKYYRQHRFNFRKSLLKNKLIYFDSKLSEYQNMVNNGFDRIWDCGNLKFEYIY